MRYLLKVVISNISHNKMAQADVKTNIIVRFLKSQITFQLSFLHKIQKQYVILKNAVSINFGLSILTFSRKNLCVR